MDRRNFIASGVFGALGLTACGGGGGGADDPAPAPTPTPPVPPTPAPTPSRFATGWVQMPVEDYRNIPEASEGNFPTVGGYDQFDLSDAKFLAEIGFPRLLPDPDPSGQGRQPSCTAWAVGYAAATATMRYSGSNIASPISPADLFAKLLRRTPNACSSGSYISSAMDTLVQEGATTLVNAPYSDQQCGIPSPAQAYQLDGFSRVEAGDATSIRGSIQMMQPVSFGILVDERFQNLSAANPVYVPNGRGTGHAMSVIGYDDSRQQYKVMNSWGNSWGAGGLFWISFADFGRYAMDVCIPYLRRSRDNELLAKTTSNQASPITAQHMKATRFGQARAGTYGTGVEMGWSSPLAVQVASLSVLNANQEVIFNQDFAVRQIARGIRFGTRVPDAVATHFVFVRSAVMGLDSAGASLTLTTFTKPYSR